MKTSFKARAGLVTCIELLFRLLLVILSLRVVVVLLPPDLQRLIPPPCFMFLTYLTQSGLINFSNDASSFQL